MMLKADTCHKTAPLILLLVIILAITSGCQSGKTTVEPDQPGGLPVLTIGTTMRVENINIEDYYFGILRAIFSHKGLVKLNENSEFTGDLAKSWETPDGQTWTFHLRDDITWHDGQKLTATDIKFTIEYNLATSIEYKSHFALVKTITIPDDNTVIIRLSQPNPRFLVNLLVLRVLPQHIFNAISNPALFNDPQAAIGCGSYIYQNFDTSAGIITFKANSHYYRGTPPIPEIRIKLFKNPDAMYMALQNGQIDLPYTYAGGADPIYAGNLAKNTRLQLISVPNLGVSKALIFNVSKPPINDPQVRLALSYAIDYNELVRLFAPDSGLSPTAGFVPPSTPGYIVTRKLEYNLDKADQLLNNAGYSKTPDGMRQKNGQVLTFELIVRNDIAENIRLAELLQKYFADAGVKLIIKLVDSTLYRTISDKEKSHTSLLSRTTPWGMMMYAGMGTGYIDARNIGWSVVSDASFQEIVDKLNTALSSEQYNTATVQLQQYYAANLPAIALYYDTFIQPYNASLSGWQISPIYGVLNEETWYNLHRK